MDTIDSTQSSAPVLTPGATAMHAMETIKLARRGGIPLQIDHKTISVPDEVKLQPFDPPRGGKHTEKEVEACQDVRSQVFWGGSSGSEFLS